MDANEFYNIVTQQTLHGHQYNATERKEIDRLMRQRDRLLKRKTMIEADLAAIRKDGAAIKKHCPATPDEIQAAIRAYKQKLHDAEALVLGMEVGLHQHRKELRRLSPTERPSPRQPQPAHRPARKSAKPEPHQGKGRSPINEWPPLSHRRPIRTRSGGRLMSALPAKADRKKRTSRCSHVFGLLVRFT